MTPRIRRLSRRRPSSCRERQSQSLRPHRPARAHRVSQASSLRRLSSHLRPRLQLESQVVTLALPPCRAFSSMRAAWTGLAACVSFARRGARTLRFHRAHKRGIVSENAEASFARYDRESRYDRCAPGSAPSAGCLSRRPCGSDESRAHWRSSGDLRARGHIRSSHAARFRRAWSRRRAAIPRITSRAHFPSGNDDNLGACQARQSVALLQLRV